MNLSVSPSSSKSVKAIKLSSKGISDWYSFKTKSLLLIAESELTLNLIKNWPCSLTFTFGEDKAMSACIPKLSVSKKAIILFMRIC